MHSVMIRNPSGDNNDISIYIPSVKPNGDWNYEFTDGRVFSSTFINTSPRWYPDKSSVSIEETGAKVITTYPMTAQPAYNSATVKINKSNTSLSKGNILVDFTAETTNGNNVIFTISTLKPNLNYLIKKDSANFTMVQADSTRKITFCNSVWSSHTLKVEESSVVPAIGNFFWTILFLVTAFLLFMKLAIMMHRKR